MRQNMARMEAEIKLNRQEVIEMKSSQSSTSRQGSQTQLKGPLISRIGSNLNKFSIESTVEVMSSTLDQCLSINPPRTGSSSSPDPTSQEVIGQINDLLAESDERWLAKSLIRTTMRRLSVHPRRPVGLTTLRAYLN